MDMNNEQAIEVDARLELADYFHASLWFSFSKMFVKLLAGKVYCHRLVWGVRHQSPRFLPTIHTGA